MYREQRRSGRGLAALLATGVLLGAGLLASEAGTQAAYAAPGSRISGGVEDGAFKLSCLSGTTAPDTGVLRASGYRDKLGNLVRIIVPYNIAVNTSGKKFKCLDSYLTDAGQYGAAVEVSLDQGDSHPAGPSLQQYAAAVTDLNRTLGGRIAYLTAWNEPDNPAYLRGNSPAIRAGQYYVAASQAFGSKVVAGDFASGVPASFLSSYLGPITRAHLHPGIWAIHPYTDVSNFQYYLHDKKSPLAAGQLAAASSKVLQLATELRAHGYGPGTDLWINEIYIDHTADKIPPAGIPGAPGVTRFSSRNQGYAALFLSGGLGADSLPGVLAGTDLPQLTRYIYLRAWDNGKEPADADALQVHAPDCVYYTLAGSRSTPAPQCS
jgi:hypothetical protein